MASTIKPPEKKKRRFDNSCFIENFPTTALLEDVIQTVSQLRLCKKKFQLHRRQEMLHKRIQKLIRLCQTIPYCTIARCQKKNQQHFINTNNSLYAWTIARTYCKSESFNSDGVKQSFPKPLQGYSKEYGKHRLCQTTPLCAPHLKFVIKKNLAMSYY